MTIGIGLLCDGGKHILLAADTRGSYGASSSNDQMAKLFELPAKYCGVIAGTGSQCADVIAELYYRMEKLPDAQIAPESVQRCIADSYEQVFRRLADESLRNTVRINLEQYWHDKTIVPNLRRDAREALKSVDVDVDLIIAGFYRSLPVQLVANGGTSITIRAEITPGNAVIGSGALAALNWLSYRKQNVHLGLAHSLLHVTEAKQFSQIESSVGPLRQVILLWPGDWKRLEGGQEILQEWWNKYGLPLSDGLEQEKYNQSVRDTFGLKE